MTEPHKVAGKTVLSPGCKRILKRSPLILLLEQFFFDDYRLQEICDPPVIDSIPA
jgi:hypothetical protein